MRSRMRRAAFCRMPAHSISFSSVMVMAGPEVLTPATSLPAELYTGTPTHRTLGSRSLLVDGVAPPAGAAELLHDGVQVGDGVGLKAGALRGDMGEPLLLGHVGQNGFADPSAVEGGGLPQDVPVGEDAHPVGRVGHIEVEDVGPVRQAEVDDLIGLAGRVHQDIIHRVGVAQVLVVMKAYSRIFRPRV